MKTMTSRMLALFVLYSTLSSPAHAYLDPATGSIVLQAIIGAVGTAFVYSRLFMAKTRAIFGRLFNRGNDNTQESK